MLVDDVNPRAGMSWLNTLAIFLMILYTSKRHETNNMAHNNGTLLVSIRSTIFGQVHLMSSATHLAKFMAATSRSNTPYLLKHLSFARSTGSPMLMDMWHVSLERSRGSSLLGLAADISSLKLLRLMLIMQPPWKISVWFFPAPAHFDPDKTMITIKKWCKTCWGRLSSVR